MEAKNVVIGEEETDAIEEVEVAIEVPRVPIDLARRTSGID
jgi:hypothetical protein